MSMRRRRRDDDASPKESPPGQGGLRLVVFSRSATNERSKHMSSTDEDSMEDKITATAGESEMTQHVANTSMTPDMGSSPALSTQPPRGDLPVFLRPTQHDFSVYAGQASETEIAEAEAERMAAEKARAAEAEELRSIGRLQQREISRPGRLPHVCRRNQCPVAG